MYHGRHSDDALEEDAVFNRDEKKMIAQAFGIVLLAALGIVLAIALLIVLVGG